MIAYVINLHRTPQRWEHMQKLFARTSITPHRIEGIDGRDLQFPHPGFAPLRYRWLHGRQINPAEVGCYLSHVKAMQAFLETTATHAMICEDDISFGDRLEGVLDEALARANHWNILRLSGLSTRWSIAVAKISGPYSLCVNIGRLKGAGAYVVDRIAAQAFVAKLVPMWLPYDHAVDREFVYGLRAISVRPFPVSQTDRLFRTLIQDGSGKRLHKAYRWLATYPYQICNETSRWVARSGAMLRIWLDLGGRR